MGKINYIKKRMKNTDMRLNKNKMKIENLIKNKKKYNIKRNINFVSHMFFSHNLNIKPPYKILLDTNFINFSIKNKLDILSTSIDCVLSNCILFITDCLIG